MLTLMHYRPLSSGVGRREACRRGKTQSVCSLRALSLSLYWLAWSLCISAGRLSCYAIECISSALAQRPPNQALQQTSRRRALGNPIAQRSAEGGPIDVWEPNSWHHMVVTWDDKRVKLYLDGKEQTRPDEGKQAGDALIALPAGPQTRINLGWRFGNWYCDCAIDQLIVYGKALTPDEVARKARK